MSKADETNALLTEIRDLLRQMVSGKPQTGLRLDSRGFVIDGGKEGEEGGPEKSAACRVG